jgi:microcystin-dependent protein
VTLDITEMPSHTHQYSDAGLPDLPVVSPGELFANAFGGASNTTSAGGDQPHENMPPFAVVRFGIWAA